MSRRPPRTGRTRPEETSSAHRRAARASRQALYEPRPFAGRPDEADLVALREVVPSATAPLHLRAEPDRDVVLATVLPLAWPAMVRRDGQVVLALQTPARSGDLGRDLGQALAAALLAAPGSGLTDLGEPDPTAPRLDDLITGDPLAVTVHPGFDWWVTEDPTPEVITSLAQANASVVPTRRLRGVEAAYWCRIGARAHLRWALPYEEDALLDALARLHVSGGLGLGEQGRYIGAFRACGLVVPVWDTPVGDGVASTPSGDDALATAVEPAAAAFAGRLAEALALEAPLTGDERRARAGVVGRQVTLR